MISGNVSFRCILNVRPLAFIMMPSNGMAKRYLKKEYRVRIHAGFVQREGKQWIHTVGSCGDGTQNISFGFCVHIFICKLARKGRYLLWFPFSFLYENRMNSILMPSVYSHRLLPSPSFAILRESFLRLKTLWWLPEGPGLRWRVRPPYCLMLSLHACGNGCTSCLLP